tara:strand:+ start:276 stop:452 length:177 start_codon:yes stop_codon:yes gene_type:complete
MVVMIGIRIVVIGSRGDKSLYSYYEEEGRRIQGGMFIDLVEGQIKKHRNAEYVVKNNY